MLGVPVYAETRHIACNSVRRPPTDWRRLIKILRWFFARPNAGINIDINNAMIAITTKSSINVNPLGRDPDELGCLLLLRNANKANSSRLRMQYYSLLLIFFSSAASEPVVLLTLQR